jgi:ATP phosphoribosyltransferase regulatory subunit
MILSGGRYDKLLQKLGKGVGAIGFALILDEMQLYYPEDKSLDADVVVIYDKESSTKELYQVIENLTSKGLKVKAERTIPTDIKYGKICKFSLGKLEDMNV